MTDHRSDGVLVSIVVPTFREAENIAPLAHEIDRVLKAARLPYEIIIVDDDSGDGIAAVVEELKQDCLEITLIVRRGERGLASAVLDGIRRAIGEIIAVMDADLSHPPERIPALVAPIIGCSADFVIGSRFTKGGSAIHFNGYRKLNALVARALARPLTQVTDPLAGFFAFPRTLLSSEVILSPLGFKIALEIVVKAVPKRISEVGIHFQERCNGESKLSFREQMNFLRHLLRLYAYKWKSRAR